MPPLATSPPLGVGKVSLAPEDLYTFLEYMPETQITLIPREQIFNLKKKAKKKAPFDCATLNRIDTKSPSMLPCMFNKCMLVNGFVGPNACMPCDCGCMVSSCRCIVV